MRERCSSGRPKGVAGDVWRYRPETESPMAHQVTAALIEVCRLTSASQVLDVGCGGGNPSVEIAASIVRQGAVFAVDTEERGLSGFARCTSVDGRRNLFVCRASAEQLPFPADAFDAATCRFGIMFFRNPSRALAELRRVLRPKAPAAFAVFGPKSQNRLYAAIEDAFADVRVQATCFSRRLFQFSRPSEFEEILERSQLELADAKDVAVGFNGSVPKLFLRHVLGSTYGAPLSALGAGARGMFVRSLEARLATIVSADTPLASYRVIAASRPGNDRRKSAIGQ
jgi:ubiquinone/menaquinone biosynthesis C-methylase UbiE